MGSTYIPLFPMPLRNFPPSISYNGRPNGFEREQVRMLGPPEKTATQTKKIGNMTVEERRKKVDKYRAKKQRRVWNRRVSYCCRKEVADKRLRIKGRFVSKAELQNLNKTEDKQQIPQMETSKKFESPQEQQQVFSIVPNNKTSQ